MTINGISIQTDGSYSGTDSAGIAGNAVSVYQYVQQYPGKGTAKDNLNFTFFEQIKSVNLPLSLFNDFGPYTFTSTEQQNSNDGSITYLDIVNGTVAANVDLSLVPDTVTIRDITATPLPSAWSMLLSGFIGLGLVAYRGGKKGLPLSRQIHQSV